MPSEIEILGSYIPGWLICALAGIVLAALSKTALARAGLHRDLPLPILFYPCLTFLWAGLLWVAVFQ